MHRLSKCRLNYDSRESRSNLSQLRILFERNANKFLYFKVVLMKPICDELSRYQHTRRRSMLAEGR